MQISNYSSNGIFGLLLTHRTIKSYTITLLHSNSRNIAGLLTSPDIKWYEKLVKSDTTCTVGGVSVNPSVLTLSQRGFAIA